MHVLLRVEKKGGYTFSVSAHPSNVLYSNIKKKKVREGLIVKYPEFKCGLGSLIIVPFFRPIFFLEPFGKMKLEDVQNLEINSVYSS